MPNKNEWFSFAFLGKSENKEITTQPTRSGSGMTVSQSKQKCFHLFYVSIPTQQNTVKHMRCKQTFLLPKEGKSKLFLPLKLFLNC